MKVNRVIRQAKLGRSAGKGVSLLEVLLMLTMLSATILPCALMLSQTGRNARDVYLQSTRSILLHSLQDVQTIDRNWYIGGYSMAAMNTSSSESGQVIPWRSVVDTSVAETSDIFRRTVYYYLYNTPSDSPDSPRYAAKVMYTRDTMRVVFNSTRRGYFDSSGQWWNHYNNFLEGGTTTPGVNSTGTLLTNYPGQAISNLPSHRDADIYRGGWWRDNASLTYSARMINGLYTVKLYFAENVDANRLMDIYLEGKLMNPGNPYSTPAYCGGQLFCANVQMFDVMVTDGTLSITLSPNSNAGNPDPYIQAIAIRKRA